MRLFPRRWDMHALQALARRDHVTLRRVFVELDGQLPQHAIDTQVETFGFGAPMQFHSYGAIHLPLSITLPTLLTKLCLMAPGFVDKATGTSMVGSGALFDRAVRGDTLLHLALRQFDPLSAVALVSSGASLQLANSTEETPLKLVFAAFAFFQLRERNPSLQTMPVGGNNAEASASLLVKFEAEYAKLFDILKTELTDYHTATKTATRDAITAIYTQHAPDRLAKLDIQVHEFEYREDQLLEIVRSKYLVD